MKRFPKTKQILLGPRGANLALFGLVMLPNIIAALLEGLSFAFILCAFTMLSHGSLSDLGAYPFPFRETFVRLLDGYSAQRAFTLFTILAILSQAVRSGLSYLGQIASARLGIRIQIEAQERVYEQILRFSFPCVSHYKTGDLVEYAKTPAATVNIVMEAVSRILVSGFSIAASLGMMVLLSPSLALLAGVLFGGLALSQKVILKKISTISRSLSDHMVDFSKETVQSLHGLRAIHIFERQRDVLKKVRNTLREIASATKRLHLWNYSITPVNEILGIGLVGTFLVVGQWVIEGREAMTLPILLTFVTIAHRLNGRIQVLLSGIATIAGNWGGILRLEEILDEKGKEFNATGGHLIPAFQREIVFDQISLTYRGTTSSAVEGVTLAIPKGSTMAFVGHSGSGKSSVMDLIVRLYSPSQGKIMVDGVSLQEIDIRSWRGRLGVVSQDTFIFNETIEENIRFGNLEATRDEIETAAKLAGAHEFILRLPRDYLTVVGERGFRLSGGERQRLSLARALVRNPDILILDEATSNLDTHSERLIQEALERFRGDKTVIIVAHRLSTVVSADQIIVLDRGRLLERGSHKELLNLGGRYASLWNLQTIEGS